MKILKLGIRILIVFTAFLFLSSRSYSQSSSNKGTEFWVGYMAHVDANAGLYLYITSDSNTTGTVSIPGQNWSKNYSVTANAMTLVAVPPSLAHVTCSDCIKNQGIKVVSQKPVVVYSHIYFNFRSDATLVLPTNTTGNEYYCMSYEQLKNSDRSEFMVVANKDNTIVKITPSVDLRSSSNGKLAANKSYDIKLNEGEVYQAKAYNGNSYDDVSGTHIQVIDTGAAASCRTVAVFSGSSWTSLGCAGSADNLYEQMYPVQAWGYRFATVPLKGVSGDNLRFLAAKDKTYVVVLNSTGAPTTFYLDAGKYYDLKDVSEAKFVIADKPIMVAQYSKTQACAGGTSDPSMTILNPVEQTLTEISLYSSQYENIQDHYINVVIPTNGSNSFRIDGNPASFKTIPRFSSYSYAQIKVSAGTHYLNANVGFNATAYGYGVYESYGYAAGANVKTLKTKIELKNSTLPFDNNVCLGQKAKLEGIADYAVKKWLWKFGDGVTDTSQKTSHLYKDTGLYTVTLYTYKSIFDGCKNFDSTVVQLRVTGVPVANFSSGLKCEGSVEFKNSSIPPPNEKIDLISWEFNPGGSSYGPLINQNFDSLGNYKLEFIVRTEAYCYDTLKSNLFINPLPTSSFTSNNVCQRDSAYFENMSQILKGKITQSKWDFGDKDSSFKDSPTHFYKDSGWYKVRLISVSDSGCQSMYIDTIYKYLYLKPDFSFKDTCQFDTVQFTNLVNKNVYPVSKVIWISSLMDTAYTFNFARAFPKTGIVQVKLFFEIDNYCKDSVIKNVNVFPIPFTDFSYSSLCTNDSITFKNNSNISSGFVKTYSWNFDNAEMVYSDTARKYYTSPGIKTVELKSISDKGCINSISKKINTGNLILKALHKADTCNSIVQEIKLDYKANNDSVTEWEWQINSTYYIGDSILKFSSSQAGFQKIYLRVNSLKNCTSSISDSLFLFPDPKADFSVTPICEGETLTPSNSSIYHPKDTFIKYEWIYDQKFVSNLKNPSIIGNAGQLPLKLIVTTGKNCTDTIWRPTMVYDKPVADFMAFDTCEKQVSHFEDKSTLANGSLLNFNWFVNNSPETPGTTFNKFFDSSGIFTIKLIVESEHSCTDSIVRDVLISAKPQIDLVFDKDSGCAPFTPAIRNLSFVKNGTIYKHEWRSDNKISSDPVPDFLFNSAGKYDLSYLTFSDKGCKNSVIYKSGITVFPSPKASFSFTPAKPSILEPVVNFLDQSDVSVNKHLWEINNSIQYFVKDPVHEFTDTGWQKVKLVVSNGFGCKDSVVKPLFVSPDIFIFIPNSFSPNNDDINDSFGLNGVTSGIKKFHMEIFNRWGELVFTSDDPDIKWDGTYRNKELPMGNYVYILLFQDYGASRWFQKKGTILLLR
ncbi:MAG: gliding motility-associated C-terminal domain-containing protein [Flavobacteriales bacterium]|nr:gliding motility-associated C-terminal domain-containing protein [Flavobacteriales bacterium]